MCPTQQISLTCHSNHSHALLWTIIPPNVNGAYTRNVPTIGDISQLLVEIAGRFVILNFTRQSVNPLKSALTIDSAVADLNGTKINCSTADSSAMAVIYVASSDGML